MSDTTKSLVGKMFSRRGTGFWLVLSQNPDYGYCHLLGLDKDFNVETTASYQPHYVERKKTVRWINIEDIRFTNEEPIMCPHEETTICTITGDTVCVHCMETLND